MTNYDYSTDSSTDSSTYSSDYSSSEEEIKPIIKWVGGKMKIMDKVIDNIPEKFNDYYEPFLGGASVFLNMPFEKKAIINDFNNVLFVESNCCAVTPISVVFDFSLHLNVLMLTCIMISTAFPNVAFSRPPKDSLVRRAISSVACPINRARGIIAIMENTKLMPVSLAIIEKYTVMGTAINNQFNLLSNGLNACKTPSVGFSDSEMSINSSYALELFCDLLHDVCASLASRHHHRRHHRRHHRHRRRHL